MNKRLRRIFLLFSVIILLLLLMFSLGLYLKTYSSVHYQETLKSKALIEREKEEHFKIKNGKVEILPNDRFDRYDMPSLYYITENHKIVKASEYGLGVVNGIHKQLPADKVFHHDYIEWDNHHYFVTSEQIDKNEKIMIYSILDSTEMIHSLEELKRTLLLMSSLFVFITLGISYLLSKRALKPLEEANRMQKQFIQDASHELKTPLSVLKTATQVLKTYEKDRLSPIGQETLIDMNDEIDSMDQLIKELLTLSKMNEHMTFKTLDLYELINKVKERFDPLLNIPINVTGLSTMIKADEKSLFQALSIVMDNAIKYNDINTLKISLNLERKATKVVLTVHDNGIGMSEEDINHMFDRFYRSKKTAHLPGTGIGLAIFKEIMTLHNAEVKVFSGDGLTFEIYFIKI